MTSDLTPHTAAYSQHAGANGQGAWIVSWLPMRLLDRNQTITALTLAEVVATQDLSPDSPWWLVLDEWSGELFVDAVDAVRRVRRRT